MATLTVFSLSIGWYLYYSCRKLFPNTMTQLMEHKGFDEEDLGMIASSFSMAYGINKLVFSVIADHVNSRKMFTSGLLLSAICVMLFPYGTTPLACSALWFVQGIVQGFGWPAALKLLKGSCRPNMFGFWWSVVSSAGNLAATLSPLFVAYVMSVTHWYISYYIIGGVTILSSFIMYFTISDLPQSNESKKTDSPSSGPLYTYKDLFTCKELWYISFIYFVLYLVKYAICDWGQLYFIQQLKMKETLAGASIGLVQFGGVFGNMVWGYISDRTLSIVPSNSKTPRAPALACCSFLFTVLLFFFSTYLDKDVPEFFISCLCFLMGMMLDGCISIIGLSATECVPNQLTGTAHGLSCACGQVGGFVAGWPFTVLVTSYSWTVGYKSLTGLCILMIAFSLHLTRLTFRTNKLRSD